MEIHAETQSHHRGLQQKPGKLPGARAVGMRKGKTKCQPHSERDWGRGESTGGCEQPKEEDDFRYHSGSMRNGTGERVRTAPALCRRAFVGIHGLLLAVVNLEDRHQFGQVQQVDDALRQIG